MGWLTHTGTSGQVFILATRPKVSAMRTIGLIIKIQQAEPKKKTEPKEKKPAKAKE